MRVSSARRAPCMARARGQKWVFRRAACGARLVRSLRSPRRSAGKLNPPGRLSRAAAGLCEAERAARRLACPGCTGSPALACPSRPARVPSSRVRAARTRVSESRGAGSTVYDGRGADANRVPRDGRRLPPHMLGACPRCCIVHPRTCPRGQTTVRLRVSGGTLRPASRAVGPSSVERHRRRPASRKAKIGSNERRWCERRSRLVMSQRPASREATIGASERRSCERRSRLVMRQRPASREATIGASERPSCERRARLLRSASPLVARRR